MRGVHVSARSQQRSAASRFVTKCLLQAFVRVYYWQLDSALSETVALQQLPSYQGERLSAA